MAIITTVILGGINTRTFHLHDLLNVKTPEPTNLIAVQHLEVSSTYVAWVQQWF
jgi:hypothetical protein